jgi:hypothetical protein
MNITPLISYPHQNSRQCWTHLWYALIHSNFITNKIAKFYNIWFFNSINKKLNLDNECIRKKFHECNIRGSFG